MLHWADGADGRGVLLSGDTIFVTPGEDRVTFVWSAPNRLPLSEGPCRGVETVRQPYSSAGLRRVVDPGLGGGISCGGQLCDMWSTKGQVR